MITHFPAILAAGLVLLLMLGTWFRVPMGSVYYVGQCAIQCGTCLGYVSDGGMVAAGAWASVAGITAWMAWRKRPPRKRKPSKVLATVRVLAHRLIVEPVPATTR